MRWLLEFCLARKFKVSGHSMEPYLHEGDHILAVGFLPILKNDVVVFKHNSKIFIKRVSVISKDSYELIGDNINDSMDSRRFGSIKKKDIIGKVILKLS